MAHVGEGTTHQNQLDELDAEIAAMEAEVKGEPQQPEATPEQVVQQPPEEPGEQPPQQYEEVITSVEEFEQSQAQPGEPSQEQAQPPPEVQQELEQTPEPQTPPQPTGRRSWKTDYLELERRYVGLRQASDRHKFETKQQIAHLQEQLLRHQQENEQMRQQMTELAQSSQKKGITDLFSQDDIDVLGEGTVQNFQKAIDTAVDSATQPLQAELVRMKKAERERLKSQAETNRSAAYNEFTAKLESLVPDYAVINVDPEFVKWLREPSPYSGAQRMAHFHQAEAVGDVERVAQFFVEYKQLKSAPQQMLEQAQTPTGQGGGSAAPVTRQPQGQPQEKIFSWAFINKFYDDDIAGKYKGRERLRDELDAEIDLAITQGRVR